MHCARMLKKKKKLKKEREIPGGSHLNDSRGTTSKQPIIFEQTLTTEITDSNITFWRKIRPVLDFPPQFVVMQHHSFLLSVTN